ncbi:MAG: anti-sigma F factor [Bacillota bacterium]
MGSAYGRLRNQILLEFLSVPENVGLARVAVASFASHLDPTLNDLEEIKVATSEAVTNSIIHGYRNEPRGRVRINAFLYDAALELVIEDDGVGIDNVELALQPAYSTDPERMGLGFVFMKSFTDELEVDSEAGKGTRIRMVKNIISADSTERKN